MKKSNLIIWIVAVCALFAAAYSVYAKYKPENIVLQMGEPQQQTSEQTSGQTSEQTSGQTPEQTQGTSAEKKVAAPDFKLKDLSGKDVSLSDYKGKVVILNFWAVWCKYCKQEMPELNELSKELEKGGDAVLLTVDVQENEKTVKDYLKSGNISVHVLMDTTGEAAQKYGIDSFPSTFIIDRDGNAVAYIPGATDKATLEKMIAKYK